MSGKVAGRLAEKFRVQYEWCNQVGIHWAPVDSSRLTQELLDSIIFVRQWTKGGYEPDLEAAERFADLFRRQHMPHLTLSEAIEKCSSKNAESFDRCLDHFRYAAWSKVLKVDLTKAVILNQPVVLVGNA